MKHCEHIQARDIRRGDVIRRTSGELVTVLGAGDPESGAVVVTMQSARGAILTQIYPAGVPVLVVAR